jgi:FHA domain
VVDVVLLAGRLLLLALLYLFLFAAIKAGIGLVAGQAPARKDRGLVLEVSRGPAELRGTRVPLRGPVIIGRSPGADIVIAGEFVSGRHARVAPTGTGAVVEDLGSTNGTLLNGTRVVAPMSVKAGDVIDIGEVRLRVGSA